MLAAFPVTVVRQIEAAEDREVLYVRLLSPVIGCGQLSFMHVATKPASHYRQRRVLQAVGTFEFFKGVFVLLMGFCALALVHKDVWLYAESLLALFHVSTDRHSAQLFLDFADNVTDARLWAAARIAFAYALLRFTEAYGLWRCRTWAEWVALVSGALLIPLEIRELLRGVTALRSAVFLGNLAVVLFMLYVIRSNRRERRLAAAGRAAEFDSPCD